jgi:hypothetical protein
MMRGVRLVLVALLGCTPCWSQDLPDPGRRLSEEEQAKDPEQRSPAAKPPALDSRPVERPRDERACEGARVNYRLSCGAPNSPRSYSRECAEAFAIYDRACR